MLKLFGLIGCPVHHSLSPLMHNDAFQSLHIDAHYHAFHVEPHMLKEAVEGLKALQCAGFNVTIPHKTAVMEYMDELDETAKQMGAVNTVVNENGKWVGYNTDGEGFVRALCEQMNIELSGARILIIGAGGAARGIYFTLLKHEAAAIDVCNRTMEKAEAFIQKERSAVYSLEQAEERLGAYDIIINTTSVGMYPHVDTMPISLQTLKTGTIVSDIIYNPLMTKFLQEAKEKGARVQNGVGMFVYQGALAFEKWTGIFPNTKRMEQLVIQQLGGKTC
ncbi:shikimate dehydrogenase [Anoxybacillus kestanbolensis]|uniref:Shikimate dehydrogenase (NADP(+)) n=1 Tax=Anoxybacillus kestanbolensis TaxID=227476 RepID=A0A1V3FTH2_9BACL|nr:shikimate dehydrogenase [Anoxybacillus kestanbolensis]OOE05003.1 shikimate dehydrogenase [Anoxybacillus kestanbolensis]